MKISILLIVLVIVFAGCTGNNQTTAESTTPIVQEMSSQVKTAVIDKLEVIHFHGTQQCTSCTTVGDYAEETVKTYFTKELEQGIISFAHVNGELPENTDLVMQYGVRSASLWLGTYKDGNFSAEENTNVWYKINNKQDFMNYLKEVIEKKLYGRD